MANIYDGVHQTPKYLDKGVMFLSVENISTLQSNKFISQEAFERDYKNYPQYGDILMTRIGNVGTPNVYSSNEKVAFYVSLALIKPHNIDSWFLCNSIKSNFVQNELSLRTLKTAIPMKINKDEIGQVGIIFPKEHNEQKKIGTLFKSLDTLITLHQRKLKFLKSHRFQMSVLFCYSWEQHRLDELFIKCGSGGTPNSSNKNYYGGNIPFLGISDLKERYISNTEKTITEEGLKNSAAWIVPAGSISLAMYASVGKVGILSKNTATSQAFFNMVFDDNSVRDFIYTRLEKADYDHEWEPLISTGTQRNLNAEKLKSFKIKVPTLEEQKLIALTFTNLDSLLTLHQRKQL